MLDAGKHQLVIDYQDFISFNCELANLIFDEYYKYEPMLNQALTSLAQEN